MLGKSKIKYIQSLGQKKFRDDTGLFIAEGPKIVRELLEAAPALIKEVYAVNEWVAENLHLLGKAKVEVVTESELDKISQLKKPNKVLVLARQLPQEASELRQQLSLAICGIQDPGNLGTIIRIADWFGVKQVICSPETADVYNPKVIQSTMGSIIRVNLFYTDIAPLLSVYNDIPVFATVLDGQDVTEMEKPAQGIILVGNESRGIPPELICLANKRITIPKKGGAESLNAAVATGIILSHLT